MSEETEKELSIEEEVANLKDEIEKLRNASNSVVVPPTSSDFKSGVAWVESEWIPGGGGGGAFTGNVWVGGTKVSVPDPKTDRYLRVELDGSGCSWVSDIPDTMPEDAEIYDSYHTAGDIHLPGNFA